MDVVKKVRNGIERIFDKTLQDLVRGVRNNKGREKEFINESIEPKLYFRTLRRPIISI